MSGRLKLWFVFALVATGALFLPVASAQALPNPLDLVPDSLNPASVLGIPGPGEILKSLIEWLVPDWVKKAPGALVGWLVAISNPAQSNKWPHIDALYESMRALGLGLLGLSVSLTTFRYYISGITGGAHPVQALPRIVMAGGMLVAYKYAFYQVIALVNTITDAILKWPVVKQGATESMKAIFSADLVGPGALLLLFAALVFIVLLLMKVALLILVCILFVVGPVAIALWPMPELSHIAKGWAYALLSCTLIPIGWCVIFATAGALSADVKGLANISMGVKLPGVSGLLGAICGFITLYFAYKWPLLALSQIKNLAGQLGVSGSAGSGVRRVMSSGMQMAGYAKVASSMAGARMGAGGLRPAAAGVRAGAAAAAGAGAGGLSRGGSSKGSRSGGASGTKASGSHPSATVANSDPASKSEVGAGEKKNQGSQNGSRALSTGTPAAGGAGGAKGQSDPRTRQQEQKPSLANAGVASSNQLPKTSPREEGAAASTGARSGQPVRPQAAAQGSSSAHATKSPTTAASPVRAKPTPQTSSALAPGPARASTSEKPNNQPSRKSVPRNDVTAPPDPSIKQAQQALGRPQDDPKRRFTRNKTKGAGR